MGRYSADVARHEDAAVHRFMAANTAQQVQIVQAWGMPTAVTLILVNACENRFFFCANAGVTAVPAGDLTPWTACAPTSLRGRAPTRGSASSPRRASPTSETPSHRSDPRREVRYPSPSRGLPMSQPDASPGFKIGASQFVGAFLLLVVCSVYAQALASSRWPPSHPYSGFTLTTLSLLLLAQQPQADARGTRLALVGAGLATLGGLAWLASAMLLAD